MTFSYLIEFDNGKKHWSPMCSGGEVAAKKTMDRDPRVIECSIYRGGRFVKTVHRAKEK